MRRLRPIVLDFIRQTFKTGEAFAILDLRSAEKHPIAQQCKTIGMPLDAAGFTVVQDAFHELYRQGYISTGRSPFATGPNDPGMNWPYYRLTEFGRKSLSSPDYVPYDSDGYIAQLIKEVPSLDRAIIRYLDESMGCFMNGFHLAASVVLGCAAEKALLQLVETFGNALADPNAKADFLKKTESWMINRKYEALWKRLGPLAKSLPDRLGDDLQVNLDQIFDLIRTTRNNAGHPSGTTVDAETVHANLILFPKYCRCVYRLIEHFSKNPIP